jgi:uncharacterized protein with PQ loop repeat
MKLNYEVIEFIGSFFISINLIPQIYHIYTIKNADTISITSVILGILSGFIMGVYGYFIHKIPVIISNIMIVLFYLVILFLKQIYNNKE